MLPATSRLTFSPVTAADRAFYYALERHPQVMRYVAENRTDDTIEAMFGEACQPWQRDRDGWLSLLMRLRSTGEPVGIYGLQHCLAHRRGELGFLLMPHFWGQGLASEATAAMIAYAFDELALHKLTAVVAAVHTGSLRVLEKQGFEREGLLREQAWLDGAWQDDVLLGLLASNRKKPALLSGLG